MTRSPIFAPASSAGPGLVREGPGRPRRLDRHVLIQGAQIRPPRVSVSRLMRMSSTRVMCRDSNVRKITSVVSRCRQDGLNSDRFSRLHSGCQADTVVPEAAACLIQPWRWRQAIRSWALVPAGEDARVNLEFIFAEYGWGLGPVFGHVLFPILILAIAWCGFRSAVYRWRTRRADVNGDGRIGTGSTATVRGPDAPGQ
jgi:hypothetical protein